MAVQGRERAIIKTLSSEDPSPTIPTDRMKKEKGNTVGDKKGARSLANKKALTLLLKPANHTP